jgi:hypothetical protein
MWMVAIGMPRGFEWLFMLALLLVPFSIGLIVAFAIVRKRREGRGFTVMPKRPDDRTPPS